MDFSAIKRKQILLASALGLGVMMIIGTFLWVLVDESGLHRESSESFKKTDITTAGRRINPQEIWVQRMENEAKLTRETLKSIEGLLMENIKSHARSSDTVEDLKKQVQELQSNPIFLPSQEGEDLGTPALEENQLLPSNDDFSSGPGLRGPQAVRKIIFHLSKAEGRGPAKAKSTVDNTLPAGTYAKGTLLSGVDASTSISSASDPRPVLLRLVDPGNLPRHFKSDLKNCHLLASAYGDLSSERVYMRLEKLTCTEPLTGEISETVVSGYVAGEDGRVGVRGVVADRAGEVMRNSLLGGFLSGMSSFFGAQQQRSAFPISPFGQTNALNAEQMLKSGAAQGTGNALDKYAEFFIKRAEQLQPVLQVAAGRKVDIVFTHGVKFGETGVKKAIAKVRDRSREAIAQKIENQPSELPSNFPEQSQENTYE
ncbi:MAG: hypothetical protein IBJ00_01525 [Alphaproteobacteria bacterium]|nr:hypothetical protein [Alphaproteobacteria bacterium]